MRRLTIRKSWAQILMYQQTWLICVKRVILHPTIVFIPVNTNLRNVDISFGNARLRLPRVCLNAGRYVTLNKLESRS